MIARPPQKKKTTNCQCAVRSVAGEGVKTGGFVQSIRSQEEKRLFVPI